MAAAIAAPSFQNSNLASPRTRPLAASIIATDTIPPTVAPTPTGVATCVPFITQSTSQSITLLNSVSCNNTNAHLDNSYWRAFAMPGGTQSTVNSVSFGVESANQTQPVTVRLYANNGGNFPGGTLTLLGASSLNITQAQSGTVVLAPLSATIPSGTHELVMELFTPDGQAAGNLFFVGSNTAPQTGPSYISAADCGVTTPTDLAALGFPNMHIVFNVHGLFCGVPTPSPTPSPTPTATVIVTPCPNTTVFFTDFDNLVPPALPAGWSATNAIGPPPFWVTSTNQPLSQPNNIFIDDPPFISDKRLDTHAVPIGGNNAQFLFESSYDFEPGFDGGVLEVSSPNINGGAFTDITDPAVGGTFLVGGYNATISSGSGNPLAGRMAWSGSSNGYTHTIVSLGTALVGHYVKFRFRMGSDIGESGSGWRIDEVRATVFCGTPVPTPTPSGTPTATATTPPPPPTPTPTLVVTTTNDSGLGSLRQALVDGPDGSIIHFDPAIFGQEIRLTTSELVVDKNITISGPGFDLLGVTRVVKAPHFRIFHLIGDHNVTIEGISIKFGDASGSSGGGILVEGGTLTLNNCFLNGNRSDGGAAIHSIATQLTLIDTIVASNFVYTGQTGGILINGGSADLVRCTVANNGNVGSGGGICNLGAVMAIKDSTIRGNGAHLGGGIFGGGFISNCTISGNSAADGAGIYASSPMTISNSTVSSNFGSGNTRGGGVFTLSATTIKNSTIAFNPASEGGIYVSSGALNIGNTLLAAGGGSTNLVYSEGTITSLGYNLSSDDAGGFLTGPGDQININPVVGPLQDNEGPTFTHALLPGSPAINTGNPAFTPPPINDQRGVGHDRVRDNRIDIGAFEVQAVLTPTPSPTSTATVTATATATGTPSSTPIIGEITLVSRLSDATASAHNLTEWDLPPAQVQTDFLPANLSNDATVGGESGAASGISTSHSSIMLDNTKRTLEVTGDGMANSSAIVQSAEARAGAKLMVLDFALPNSSYTYSLTGMLAGGGNGGFALARAKLTNGNGTTLFNLFAGVGGPPSVTLSETGILQPGSYTFSVELESHTVGDIFMTSAQSSGNYIFALATAPTPTPTITPTPTPTPTPSPSPSASPTPSPSQLANISTRLHVGTGDDVGIGGFIITPSTGHPVPSLSRDSGPLRPTGGSLQVVIRAIGPSLGQVGVPDPLIDPILEVRDSSGVVLLQNDNWQDDEPQAKYLEKFGLAPTEPAESGLIIALPPGAYTATVLGKNNGTGTGLVEVYNVDESVPSNNIELANISTRGFVQIGENVMIGGFILTGGTNNNGIAIRGIGPSLTQFGINNALVDPTIELRDNNGALLVANDNWQDDPSSAAELTARGLAPQNFLESGIFVTLQPNTYTAILAGKDGGTGVGLVEIYNLN